MTIVLDASAVIALMREEAGAERVAGVLEAAASATPAVAYISTVNLTEVLQHEPEDRGLIDGPDAVVLSVDYDVEQARVAAAMLAPARTAGLGLADRVCLALARVMGLPALTADRAWSELDVGVEIIQIR